MSDQSVARALARCRLLLFIAAALLAIVVVPSSASAAFDVGAFSVTPSTTTKSANPDLAVSFTRTGTSSEDLKSFDFHLPAGLSISTGALPKCTEADLNRDRCPTGSLLGGVGADARTDVTGSYLRDIPGSIYAIPNANGAQRIGIVLRPSGFGALTGVQTISTGSPISSGLKASVGNVTRSLTLLGLFPVDVTFNAVSFRYLGKGRAGETIVTNPANCISATTTLVARSWQNVSKTKASSFIPSGCGTPPVKPTVAITAPGVASTTDATTNVAFAVNGGTNIPAGVTCTVNGSSTTNTQTNNVNLALGPNTITVACGNTAGADTKTALITRDPVVVAPDVRITAPTATEISDPEINVAFEVNGVASIPDGVVCFVNGIPTTSATTNSVALSFGSNAVTVSCSNSAGADTENLFILRPTVPPTGVRITTYAAPSTGLSGGGPTNATAGPTPNIAFAVQYGTASSFECRIVGVTAWGPCTASDATSGSWNIPIAGLADGAIYTYQVRALTGPAPGPEATGYFVNDSRPSAATAAVTAKPNAITPSGQETQAGRHPNLESQVSLVGWDDPASLTVKFPDGLMGSLAAVPAPDRCTLAQANSGTCPASSRIGSVAGLGVSSRDGALSASGWIYLVRPADVPSQYAAGVAINLAPDIPSSQDLGEIRAIGYIGVRNELQQGAPLRTYDGGRNMFLTIPNVPNVTVIGTGTESRQSARRLHISTATLTVDGTVGSSNDPATNRPLVTNPHYCGSQFPTGSWNRPDQKRFVGSGTGYAGTAIGSFTAPYSVTCTTQSFAPNFDFKIKAFEDSEWTTSKPASTGVMVRATTTLPDEALSTPNATIARAALQLPPSLVIDFANTGSSSSMCGASSVYPSVTAAGHTTFTPGTDPSIPSTYCPPSSILGTARIESSLYPGEVVGRVYGINVGPIPFFGIWIDPSIAPTNPQGVSFGLFVRADSGAIADEGDGDIQTIQLNLNSLPDIPITRFELTIGDNPSRGPRPGGGIFDPTVFTTVGSLDVGCRPSPGDDNLGIPAYPVPWNAIARFRPWSNIASVADMTSAIFSGVANPAGPKDVEVPRTPVSVTGCEPHF